MRTFKFTMVLILTLTSVLCFSQTDFNIKRKKLQPIKIDTTSENLFVYEVPNVILYFRQNDIRDYLSRKKISRDDSKLYYQSLKDTLTKGARLIKVKDIFFSYGERERDSILLKENISHSEQQLNEAFHYIGADLVLQNKFLIVNKKTGQVVTKGIVAKRVKGLYGTKYLDFQLPKRKSFYQVLITLGE